MANTGRREAHKARPARIVRAVASATALLVYTMISAFLLTGCGSGSGSRSLSGVPGGGNSSGTLLQGNAAVRAVSVAGYQALGAGIGFPYAALQIAKPTGSAIGSAMQRAAKAAASAKAARNTATRATSSLRYDEFFGLYAVAGTASGSTYTINYFSDAAGTIPAGTLSVNLPGTSASSDGFDTNYVTYPTVATMTANLTAGNIPCTGTVTITFTGPSGSNTMNGTLNLTRNHIVVDIALTLTDNLEVGGSATIRENSTTIQISSVTGNLDSSLTGPVTVAPYGWTGTGTFSLATGAFSLELNLGNGTMASAALNASGSLVVNYPDATSESVLSPLVASLTTSTPGVPGGGNGGTNGGSGGGNNGGGSNGGNTDTPVYLPPISTANDIQAISDSGAMISSDLGQPSFYATPQSSPQRLPMPDNISGGQARGINSANQIVGVYYSQTGQVGLYWTNPNEKPVFLKVPEGAVGVVPRAINDTGQIVGYSYDKTFTSNRAVYWSSYDAEPQFLSLALSHTESEAIGINNKGVIIGNFTPPDTIDTSRGVVWTTASAVALVLPSPSGADTITTATGINDSGQIVGLVREFETSGALWTVEATGSIGKPVALAVLLEDDGSRPFSISNEGKIVGLSQSGNGTSHVVLWNGTSQVRNLQDLIPGDSGWKILQASHINAQGVISGSGQLTQGGASKYCVIVPR